MIVGKQAEQVGKSLIGFMCFLTLTAATGINVCHFCHPDSSSEQLPNHGLIYKF